MTGSVHLSSEFMTGGVTSSPWSIRAVISPTKNEQLTKVARNVALPMYLGSFLYFLLGDLFSSLFLRILEGLRTVKGTGMIVDLLDVPHKTKINLDWVIWHNNGEVNINSCL